MPFKGLFASYTLTYYVVFVIVSFLFCCQVHPIFCASKLRINHRRSCFFCFVIFFQSRLVSFFFFWFFIPTVICERWKNVYAKRCAAVVRRPKVFRQNWRAFIFKRRYSIFVEIVEKYSKYIRGRRRSSAKKKGKKKK